MARIRCEPSPSEWPLTVALPAVGEMSPASIRTVVVLPAPFGPSRPKISPSPTVKAMSCTAVRRRKSLRRPSTTIMRLILAAGARLGCRTTG